MLCQAQPSLGVLLPGRHSNTLLTKYGRVRRRRDWIWEGTRGRHGRKRDEGGKDSWQEWRRKEGRAGGRVREGGGRKERERGRKERRKEGRNGGRKGRRKE